MKKAITEALWDITDQKPELRGRLDRIVEILEASEAYAETINAEYQTAYAYAMEGFERRGGGFGGGRPDLPKDDRFDRLIAHLTASNPAYPVSEVETEIKTAPSGQGIAEKGLLVDRSDPVG